jgi:hypothetical protein
MGSTYGDCVEDILGKYYALRLDNEEVDELLNVLQGALEILTGDGVVLARAER